MSQPRVSIVMPVRNSDRFLARTVDSLLAQTFGDFELIVVDGGSTDRTLDILSGYKDPRIRIFEKPLEITPARNFGIAQAVSPWIAAHDSDDISLPRRLELQWNALNRTPNAVLSYTDANIIGNVSAAGGRARFPRTQAFLAMRLCYQFPMVHSAAMFSKEAALAAGGYTWRWAEDYGLAGRLVERGRTVAIPKKLVEFRLHPTSNTHKLMSEMNAMAVEIALDNCRRLMRLADADARRAHAALINRGRPGQWREWSWFLRSCVPRLPWKSLELSAWLGLQTMKLLRPGKVAAAPGQCPDL
jgi:glycosyltransferase involved in cell wall biosynthesis